MQLLRAIFIMTILFLFGAMVPTAVVQAQTSPVGEVREFFNGARMMGMGGAGIAVVNDETALLVNPAGLGKLRDFYGTIIDPEVDASSTFPYVYKTGDVFAPSDVQAVLDTHRETYYHARAQIFPSLVVKNFGIGIFARQTLDAYIDSTGANMQTYYVSDLALLLGYNLRLWDGRIKIGVTGKAISRVEIDKNLDTTGALDVGSNASEGAAVGADVGVILTAPWTWLPTLSAVVRDVGGTNFEAGSGLRMTTATRPNHIDQDIDVALAVFPIHSNSTRSAFTLEYQKITAASQATDKLRYAHVGYELNYSDLLFFRLGMNQRYWTAGVELSSEHTQVQVTSYGEDIGPDNAPIEDRRLILKFSFRF
jgi:hypothetical protein